MKKTTLLCLCLFVSGTVLAMTGGNSAKRDDAFQAFWQKFKTAVISGDKKSVASLSRFPIGMSYGIRNIKNRVELNRRYPEVFSEQTNAVKCFGKKEPERDAESAERFSVACPNEGGEDVVIYMFERTKTGWKFVRLDNINE